MKFDVVIGNPPYQESVGGGNQGTTAVPMYTKFIDKSDKLGARCICMIVPTRWYTGDGIELENIRKLILNENTSKIVDYADSKIVFPGVTISGGVGYFLVDKRYKGVCHIVQKDTNEESYSNIKNSDIFISFKHGRNIIEKINNFKNTYVRDITYPGNPFGLITSVRGKDIRDEIHNIKVKSSAGYGYIKKADITKNIGIVDKFKVITGYKRNSSTIINKPEVLGPGEVCTQTYMVIGSFNSLAEANNYSEYVKTRFFRMLILITLNGSNVTRKNYQLIPMQDFSKPWTDEELYKKYNLTEEEINYIERTVKEME